MHTVTSMLEQSFNWLSGQIGMPAAAVLVVVLMPILVALLFLALDKD